VDDYPRNNAYECRSLAALGIHVEFVTSTDEALAKVRTGAYDVILSDMARERPDAGLVMLRRLRESGCRTEVIFYVGQLDKRRGLPIGAFGITNQPEPLLHYVFDVLERQRL
jgi:CheY-like chemotaxis protein